jgi:cellulose synthase (UDP-forming)
MAVVVKGTPEGHPATAPRHRRPAGARDLAEPRPPADLRDLAGPRAPAEPAAWPSRQAEPRAGVAAEVLPPRPAPPHLVLPVPPRDDEKYSYIRRGAWILTLCSAVSFPLLVLSQFELIGREHWFWFFAPFILFGILLFSLPLLTDGIGRGFDLGAHQRLIDAWRPARLPSVDVFLPVCGEPIEVLRNTWTYVAAMADSYTGPIVVWVLDDSADPALKDMAREFGFAYASRPNRGWLKKSGNLLYGYLITEGEFILLLDADFAPRPELLAETLPYMDCYPKTGIVQTPQFFRVSDEQTWIERGAGAVQELFYRSIQTARARKGGATCVGTCAVYRRAALDDNKGMALMEHSEDLWTGFDLQRIGWEMRYVPVAMSTGTCPDNLVAFANQQYRWCSGTMSMLSSKAFWRAKLPFYARMCHISGFVYYLYTAIFTFAVPALSIAILLFTPGLLELKNMLFFLPVLAYSTLVVPMWHRSPYRLEAWAVRLVSGWAHTFACWDLITGRRRGWQPTGGAPSQQDGRRRLWVALLGWNAAASVTWVALAFWRLLTLDPANVMMIFALGLFDLVVVIRVLIQPRAGRFDTA